MWSSQDTESNGEDATKNFLHMMCLDKTSFERKVIENEQKLFSQQDEVAW